MTHDSTNSRPARHSVLFLATLLALFTCTAWSQSPISTLHANGAVTEEQIETTIQAIEVRQGLDEEVRTRIIEQLRDAQAQLRNTRSSEADAAAFAKMLETAPDQTAELRRQLDVASPKPPTRRSIGVGDDASLQELEPRLSKTLADLASEETRLSSLDSQVKSEEGRPAAARKRIKELQVARVELSELIASTPPPDENALQTDARKLVAALKLDALEAEQGRLEQELLSHGLRLELLRAQRDLAARDAQAIKQRAELLQALVSQERQSSVEQARNEASAAELAAADKHPAVRELAEINAALTDELPKVAADIDLATGEIAEMEQQASEIEQRVLRSRQRLEVGGVTQAIGRLLVEERRNLPSVSLYRNEVRERGTTLANIGLAQVRIEEQRKDLATIAPVVESTMDEVAVTVVDPDELASIRSEVAKLLADRRALLDQAANTYRSYLQALGDLDIAQRRLLDSADEYRRFLDENLLWIPSTGIIGVTTLTDLAAAVGWALSPRSWADATAVFHDGMRGNLPATVIALLIIASLLLTRRPLKGRFKAINDRIGRLSTDSIGLTFAALAISAIRAAPLPAFLAILGWALRYGEPSTDFTSSLGQALRVSAPFLYNLLLFRVLCARDGVARLHFGWQKHSLVVIRRQLDQLLAVGTPLVFVTVLAYASTEAAYRDSLGRFAFIAFMIVLAIVMQPLSNPNKSVAKTYYDKRPRSWISRLRWVWYSIEVGGPIALALLSSIGYLYTAAILTGHLIDTIWLVLFIVLANLVVLRWLALARRKIALQLALERREARRAEKAKVADESQDVEAEADMPLHESEPLDLDAVDQQTRRLLQAGLFFVAVLVAWGIWSQVLPALSVLQDVSLWTQTTTVGSVETAAPVTLADLMLALVIAGVTWVASRNLPGLMEIAVLQRLDLQPGSRYTINTLLRYAVVTIGLFTILSIIGWNWSRIQWLVAALSVGLGFGLQEIVANFVSGLIILFERPVRVGDTVTVGTLTGTVSKVRIRATTITDWDRKEIIVPNKAFITDQVINWTLSDPITRIQMDVGISYGSDVKLAHRVIEDALRSQPLILDDPTPRAYFMGFGDSSLNFRLYVFARQLADRLPIMHAVHEDVLQALRDHNVEIPFPQRDVHVRSVAPDPADAATRDAGEEEK